MKRVAVIGIGQRLRGDDAAGLEAIHQWRHRYPETANRPEVRTEALELAGLNLLAVLENMDAAILVDAVHGPNSAGEIYRLREEEISFFSSDTKSAHGWGVAETLKMGRLLGMLDEVSICILGIQAGQMNLGEGISWEVRGKIPSLCEAIQEELNILLAQ